MEERYEIRGKIGQGGLGAVYRGVDTRMNREVAIKRIMQSAGDPELQEESTRQLMKEAGALASLQHPHIVTIYDVGKDEDGPFVVMELISGKTLDELIERAPLTWPDFRELAMQTQEALIAAQELDLIHSDIKPSNLMLTWLPSGKFQVKIVDFGLATLTQSQSREELEELEAVFGSIFFMPPEQFERVPLDARSDLYSMGCVYYQALAGVYPFNGNTGHEVMQAHLGHKVKPLQELRADIPLWVCDWIMWQINRLPQDRPESARDSLSVFLQNDKNPNPTMSMGAAQAASAQKRPKLIIPGANPTPAAPTSQPSTSDSEEETKTITAPQPLTPPEGFKPSVHTGPQELPPPEPQPTGSLLMAAPTARVIAPAQPLPPPAKRKLSNSSKTAIAAILGILVVLLAWYLLNRSGKNRETKLYNEMVQAAARDAEVPVNSVTLEILLKGATNTGMVEQRQNVYKALFLAKATDATDVDTRIAEFATTQEMLPDVREVLIRDVLRKRKNPSVVPTLLAYAARSTNDPRSAVAALQAVRYMAGDEQFGGFLEVIQTTKNDDVRKAAEETMVQILKKSSNKADFAEQLADAHEGAIDDSTRHSLLRLLGRCGGAKATEQVKKSLDGAEVKDKIAALITLGSWPDDSAFQLLTDFIASSSDEALRDRAFKAAFGFLSDPDSGLSPENLSGKWTELSGLAKTTREQLEFIRGIAKYDDEWASKLIEGFAKSDSGEVADLAEKALDRIRERRKLKSK
jgi:serine/threonine protein kinase/pyruvoyl-dependent arginine decarboxylase (PvlArgDC)